MLGNHRATALPPLFLRGLAAFAVALGFIGFMGLAVEPGWAAVHSAVLKTAQLFILQLGPSDLGNWQTRVASVLAPVSTAGAAWAAFSGGLQRWSVRLSMRMRPARDLFLGGGKTARAIADNLIPLRGAHHRSVGVDHDADAQLTQIWRNKPGSLVIQGDATSQALLQTLNILNTQDIWIVAGDDQRNIDILQSLLAVYKQPSAAHNLQRVETGLARRRWYVDIGNRDTVRLAANSFHNPDGVAIEYLSIERTGARRLMQLFARDVLPDIAQAPTKPTSLHVCLIGRGKLAEAILVQCVQQLVVSDLPEHCIRITWIAPDATTALRNLQMRIPVLDEEQSHVESVRGLLPLAKIHALDCDEQALSWGAWADAQADQAFSCVYIANADKLQRKGATLRVCALRDASASQTSRTPPVVACHLSDAAHAADVLQVPTIRGLTNFFVLNELIGKREHYPGESMDDLAKVINASYARGGGQIDDIPDREFTETAWSKLADPMRWSSRMCADHVMVKDALLNKIPSRAGMPEGKVGLAQSEVGNNLDWLARIEHRRFTVERLVEGWLPLPVPSTQSGLSAPSGLTYAEQKNWFRLNQTMVPYDALPQSERDKMLPSIKALPGLCAMATTMANRAEVST
jgi:TrkA-N domain